MSNCKACGGRYEGGFARCQACLELHWWDESRLRYASTCLGDMGTSEFHETGWACWRQDTPSVVGKGPTHASALADLRRKAEEREGTARVREWVDYMPPLQRGRPVPEEYGPDNLGCFERPLGVQTAMGGFLAHVQTDDFARQLAWSSHKRIADGLTTFMQWVGEPVERGLAALPERRHGTVLFLRSTDGLTLEEIVDAIHEHVGKHRYYPEAVRVHRRNYRDIEEYNVEDVLHHHYRRRS